MYIIIYYYICKFVYKNADTDEMGTNIRLFTM